MGEKHLSRKPPDNTTVHTICLGTEMYFVTLTGVFFHCSTRQVRLSSLTASSGPHRHPKPAPKTSAPGDSTTRATSSPVFHLQPLGSWVQTLAFEGLKWEHQQKAATFLISSSPFMLVRLVEQEEIQGLRARTNLVQQSGRFQKITSSPKPRISQNILQQNLTLF